MITDTDAKDAVVWFAARRAEPLRWRDGLPVYFQDRAPAGLKTRRQLREAGLSAAGLQPVAWIHTAHHDEGPLYDPAKARAVRPITAKQAAALEAGRRLAGTVACGRCGTARVLIGRDNDDHCPPCATARWKEREKRVRAAFGREHVEAVEWARDVLADPEAVVLDTETTGLYGAWIVEIAVVEVTTRRVLLDTLVNPQEPIPAAATAIHGITDTDVADSPTFNAIAEDVLRAVAGRRLVIYNADFDLGMLQGEAIRLADGPTKSMLRQLRAECAMEWYAQWFGDWHPYWGNYTWQKLRGGHRAVGDCQTVITRLAEMTRDDGALDNSEAVEMTLEQMALA